MLGFVMRRLLFLLSPIVVIASGSKKINSYRHMKLLRELPHTPPPGARGQLFDDQFKLVQSFSTARQVNVQNSYTNNNTSVSGITMPRNGYLYVYTSNEAALDSLSR
jgi:hypothetical protein